MSDLKDCPFCGSDGLCLCYFGQPAVAWAVTCLICGSYGGRGETAGAAAEAWNTRATAAPVVVGEDTKRLDWLATQFRTCTVYMNGSSLYKPGVGIQSLIGADFRSAIDAGMTAALAGD